MDRSFFLANLWRWAAGAPELPEPTVQRLPLEKAKAAWFPAFIELMRNRMMLGTYRYGDFRDPAQPNYDRIGSAITRIGMYAETGNGEHLVDAANLLGIEFKRTHPRWHFDAADDGAHVEIKR